MCANLKTEIGDLKCVIGVQDEGVAQTNARASACTTGNANVTKCNGSGAESADVVAKKRKTRRGKPKRRNLNPYAKPSFQQKRNASQCAPLNRRYRSNKVIAHGQALAPYNSNQFLMEDHGEVQQLDDKLNKSNAAGTSMPVRTRDSSFSVDSDVDFYSSPEDEEEFLSKEFDIEYKDYNAERLQAMSKAELIGEYLLLENKVDTLTKKLLGKSTDLIDVDLDIESAAAAAANVTVSAEGILQQQIHKLMLENDKLKRENEHLRNGMCRSASCSSYSSSMDSESDSSSSCSTLSSENDVKIPTPSLSPSPSPPPTHSPTSNLAGGRSQPSCNLDGISLNMSSPTRPDL